MKNKGNKEFRKAEKDEIQIDLWALFLELLKKLWLIILVGLIVGSIAFVAAKIWIKPVYRSGFTAYVNNQQQQGSKDYLTNSDLQAAQSLVHTYEQIIQSNTILMAAADSLGLDESYASIKKKVSTQIKENTEIITVYVVSTNPEYAYDMATAIAKIAPKYMANIVDGSSMKIIDYPEMPQDRYKPNYKMYAIIGFLAGALLVVIIIIIRFMTDDKVKSDSEVEAHFSLPILGVIPDISTISKHGSGYYEYRYGGTQNNSERRKDRNEKK